MRACLRVHVYTHVHVQTPTTKTSAAARGTAEGLGVSCHDQVQRGMYADGHPKSSPGKLRQRGVSVPQKQDTNFMSGREELVPLPPQFLQTPSNFPTVPLASN